MTELLYSYRWHLTANQHQEFSFDLVSHSSSWLGRQIVTHVPLNHQKHSTSNIVFVAEQNSYNRFHYVSRETVPDVLTYVTRHELQFCLLHFQLQLSMLTPNITSSVSFTGSYTEVKPQNLATLRRLRQELLNVDKFSSAVLSKYRFPKILTRNEQKC